MYSLRGNSSGITASAVGGLCQAAFVSTLAVPPRGTNREERCPNLEHHSPSVEKECDKLVERLAEITATET